MRTIRVKLYEFNELSETAKKKALIEFSDVNTNYDWWELIYQDAASIGLEITAHDLDQMSCNGKLKESLSESCQKIIANHGELTETHKTATAYLAEWAQLVAELSDGINTDKVSEGNESEFDELADELENQFKRSLLNDYCKILQKEYNYRTSEQAIIKSIIANKYEFTSEGKFWSK